LGTQQHPALQQQRQVQKNNKDRRSGNDKQQNR